MRKIIIFISVLAMSAGTIGCSVNKEYFATGGSRADGTIDLTYEYSWLEKPIVDESQGRMIAVKKCGQWGYNNAEPFGGIERQCSVRNGFGDCISFRVVNKYQCLGDLGANSNQKQSAPLEIQAKTTPRYIYSAEDASTKYGCSNQLVIESVAQYKEIYSTACNGKKTFIICDYGNCLIQ